MSNVKRKKRVRPSQGRSHGLSGKASSRRGPAARPKASVARPEATRRKRASSAHFSAKNLKNRARRIASAMIKEYPQAKTALKHRSALQLLIATILSAQCTDERVNVVTRDLFRKYRTAADFATADPNELETEIHSVGFFRQKARSIIQCCKDIVDKHDSRVPDTIEELTSLRGVGRKTANVVLANVHGTPAVVVDTHVKRISLRLELTRNTDPDRIEQDIMRLLPKDHWAPFSGALILHGRAVCAARKPSCHACVVKNLCPSSTVQTTS